MHSPPTQSRNPGDWENGYKFRRSYPLFLELMESTFNWLKRNMWVMTTSANFLGFHGEESMRGRRRGRGDDEIPLLTSLVSHGGAKW